MRFFAPTPQACSLRMTHSVSVLEAGGERWWLGVRFFTPLWAGLRMTHSVSVTLSEVKSLFIITCKNAADMPSSEAVLESRYGRDAPQTKWS